MPDAQMPQEPMPAQESGQGLGVYSPEGLQAAQQAHTTARTTLTNANTDLTRANAELDNVQRDMAQRQNQIAGSNLHRRYADSITTRSWRNLWQGATMFVIPRAQRDAAAKIRTGRTENERLLDAVRGIQGQGGGTH